MRTILITGGTGFVGPYLIRLLQSASSRIVVISSGNSIPPPETLEYRKVDLRDLAAVRRVMHEIVPDEIYHLAGITAVNTSWDDPRSTFEVNVVGTYNLFEAAMSFASPPRILSISTAQVYAPSATALTEESPLAPDSPYAASKAMAELLTIPYRRAAAGGVVIARAFNHSGPGQSPNFLLPSLAKQFAEIRDGKRQPTIIIGNTDVRRDFTDVRDVARAYQMLLAHGEAGEPYNVCSGAATRLADIIEKLEALTGVKVALQVDPARVRASDIPQICGDPTKIRQATSWCPQFSLTETLQGLLNHWSGGR